MGEVLDVEGTSVEDIMEEDMAIMGGVGGGVKDAIILSFIIQQACICWAYMGLNCPISVELIKGLWSFTECTFLPVCPEIIGLFFPS